jgi:hypothetical protein
MVERWNGSAWIEIAQLAANDTGYSNSGLTQNTTYYYRLSAFNDAGSSPVTNWVSAITLTEQVAPEAPTDLTANAISASQIDLSWTDNADNETGFTVDRWNGTTWTEMLRAKHHVYLPRFCS